MSRNRLLDVLDRTERELWVFGAIGYGLALLGSLMPIAHTHYLRAVLGPSGPSLLVAVAFCALQIAVFCFAHWRSRTVFQRALDESRLMEAIAAGDENLAGFSQLATAEMDNKALKSQLFRLGVAVGPYLAKHSSAGADALSPGTRKYGLMLLVIIHWVYTYSSSLDGHIQQLIASNAMRNGHMFFVATLLLLGLGWMFSVGYPISDLTIRYLRREMLR